jgi:DNA-binding NarL/FixJ family response regulator
MPTRILLADDHTIMRQGLRQILEHEADFTIVAVVNIAMKELNGIEATSQILKDAREAEDPFESLTERERHVYQLLAEGNCNKDIANRLDLSLHTVETHRWRIMEKMNLRSMAELVLSAVRRGMVS